MFLGDQKNINCSALYTLNLWGKRLPSKNIKNVKLIKYRQKNIWIVINSLQLNSYKTNRQVIYYKPIYNLLNMSHTLLSFTYNKLGLYNILYYKTFLILNLLNTFPITLNKFNTLNKPLRLSKLKKLLNQ